MRSKKAQQGQREVQREKPSRIKTADKKRASAASLDSDSSLRHTFAVCAYGESPYLEACLQSLKHQKKGLHGAGKCTDEPAKSKIILCTSTPSAFLEAAAARHGIPLYVREGKSSLRDDWNFAVACAKEKTGAELVTIAHQDDIYHADYAAALLNAARRYPDLSVFCTRYRTIDGAGKLIYGKAEAVKRILRLPLRLRVLANRRFVKRLPLRFGNGIGCPSCSYRLQLCGLPLFRTDAQFVIDWDTLWRLSGQPGRFVCVERPLLDYRVHAGAATMKNIENHNREREETAMFRVMWPAPLVRVLMHFYKKAYTAYPPEKAE